jgi:hypothetical protein
MKKGRVLKHLAIAAGFCVFSSLAAGQDAVTQSVASFFSSGEYLAEETYVADASVERGRHAAEYDESDTIVRYVATPRIGLGVLRLGAEWERFAFGFPSGAPLPSTLQSISLVLGLDTQISDSILMRFEAQPGVYDTGFEHVSDDFNMPFLVGGTYIYSPNLQFIVGVSVDIERKYPVIPAAGFRWQIARQWVANASLPTPRLEYEWNRNLTVYLGADVKETNYRVDDNFGDKQGKPELNHAVLTYSEVRTGTGLNWKIAPSVILTAEAGYQPYRSFDFYRTNVRYHQDGSAPYGMISLHGAF